MKKLLLLLLAAVAVSACSVTRRVSMDTSWKGSEAADILAAMGDPDRIAEDGHDGSILIYEPAPDYEDPRYDILDPEASARKKEYAHFYLNQEGRCYQVDSNRTLPSPPERTAVSVGLSDLSSYLVVTLLLVIGLAL